MTFGFDNVADDELVDAAQLRQGGVAPARTRRAPDREELRARILDAVARLHDRGGYDAVTMRAVAQEVGVSAMSLYRYFPSKAALLEQVWFGVLDDALAAARSSNRHDSSPFSRLRRLYASYAEFWLSHPQDFRLLFDPACEIPANLVRQGPALRFRREAESLIDACLGPGADLQQRELAYDLCRAKVVGYLYTCVGMETKPHRSPHQLLAVLLDDIERQLRGA